MSPNKGTKKGHLFVANILVAKGETGKLKVKMISKTKHSKQSKEYPPTPCLASITSRNKGRIEQKHLFLDKTTCKSLKKNIVACNKL